MSIYGISENLYRLDENIEPQPWIAESVETPDENTWVFTIRDGVTFSNGKTVDAKAVKACFERTYEKNERADSTLKIKSMEADGMKFTIVTPEPNPTLLNDLCDPPVSYTHLDVYKRQRIGRTAYCWSHLVVAFFGSVISIFLGMAVVYGVLALKIPWIKKEELETLTGSLSYGNGLVLPFYLAARFGVEAVKYAFMAVFALMISGKIKNLFVLVSTPALFYYASQLVAEALQLPGQMRCV